MPFINIRGHRVNIDHIRSYIVHNMTAIKLRVDAQDIYIECNSVQDAADLISSIDRIVAGGHFLGATC